MMLKKYSLFVIFFLFIFSFESKSQISQPEWSKNAVIYEVNIRQFSEQGTIKAFMNEIPRLKELGVNVLHIMPFQPIGEKERRGKAGNYYSIRNHKGIAEEYGTYIDFQKLLEIAHSSDMKVLIDWVAASTSWDHKWMLDHPEWYVRDDSGHVKIDSDGQDEVMLNYDFPQMREAMKEAMGFWIREFDVDGFRFDNSAAVPLDFWEEASAYLNNIKPVYLIADINPNEKSPNPPNKYFDSIFNASYAYAFMEGADEYLKGKKTSEKFKEEIKNSYRKLPSHTQRIYFLTNHFENAFIGTIDSKYGKNWQQVGVMVYTLPQSIPSIYTGEDAAVKRGLKFYDREGITKKEWENKSRVEWYKSMTTLKNTALAFQNASQPKFGFIDVKVKNKPANEIIAYITDNGKEKAFVFINFGKKKVNACFEGINLNEVSKDRKSVSNKKQNIKSSSEITLQPYSYIVYYK